MKRIIFMFVLVLFAAGFAFAQASKGGTMYVAVKSAPLKSSPDAFASTRITLNYGDRVTILQISGKNAEVRSATTAAVVGWTALSNLSAKQIVSGNKNIASAREVALAGKGFNQEVENSYKSQGKLNYADVDKVETFSVNEADLKKFLEDGRLEMGN
ncbi:MAG: hypothetical protein LBV17_00965 [Treponema sp.]|jgi:hypothetical protein|nr:hypothetical protein [Treponema sp.]